PAGDRDLEELRLLGLLLAVAVEAPVPLLLPLPAALTALTEMGERLVRHVEVLVRVPAVELLGRPHLVLPERRAVGLRGVLLVGRAVADVRANADQRRPVLDRLRL